MRTRSLVGFLPAAGHGTRFGSSPVPKELYPLLPLADEPGAGLGDERGPRPLCERWLRALRLAGAERVVVVIGPHKLEVVRALGDGGEPPLPLAYVLQPEPRGLAHALRLARPWLDGADVLLALPDTLIEPLSALRDLHEARLASRAELGLAVFATAEAARLGPVVYEGQGDGDSAGGKVLAIEDKPARPSADNTWGLASLSPRCVDFLCRWDEEREAQAATASPRERAIGHGFEAARAAGLATIARPFPDGSFLDIGTPAGLRAALLRSLDAAAGGHGSSDE